MASSRSNNLICTNKHNVDPQLIEETVEKCHPSLQPGCAAAFTVEEDGKVQFVVAVEVERRLLVERRLRQLAEQEKKQVVPSPDAGSQHHVTPERGTSFMFEEVVTSIRNAISDTHSIEADNILLLIPGTVPKSSSGKIQRQICKNEYLNKTLELIAVNSKT